jgi:hypothetical protein
MGKMDYFYKVFKLLLRTLSQGRMFKNGHFDTLLAPTETKAPSRIVIHHYRLRLRGLWLSPDVEKSA